MQQQKLTPEQMLRMRAHFRQHPDWFFRNWLGFEAYDLQLEVANSVRDNRTTSVASCNSAGKTGIAGCIVPWFLLSFDESIVITTAPKWQQVKDLLWREINTRWEKAKYPLSATRPNVVGWQLASNWFAVGISGTEPTRVQGYHSDSGWILLIADEAAGIEQLMFEGYHAMLTSDGARFLMLGNPTSQAGEFRDSFKPGSLAHRIRIDAFNTPNFRANGITNEADLEAAITSKRELAMPYPSLISPIWAYERYKKWGFGSPMYQARVRAQFPKVGENNLIPLDQIEAATTDERLEKVLGLELSHLDPLKVAADKYKLHEAENDRLRAETLARYIESQNTARGVDVARFGSDTTVIQPRWGAIVGPASTNSKQDTMQTAGKVWAQIDNVPTDTTGVDVIGVGGGVVDRLRELQREAEAKGQAQFARILGVDVASKPDTLPTGMAQMEFANKRAELYWHLRELFESGDIYLMPGDDGQSPEDLMDELSSIQYEFRGNKIYIEEKQQMKKRLLKSPDRADALMLSYEIPDNANWAWTTPDAKQPTEAEDEDWEPATAPGGQLDEAPINQESVW